MLLSASLISKLGELVRNSKLVKQGELLGGMAAGAGWARIQASAFFQPRGGSFLELP